MIATVTQPPALTLVPPLPAPSKRYPDLFSSIAAYLHKGGFGPEAIPPLFEGCALADEYTARTRAALASLEAAGPCLT